MLGNKYLTGLLGNKWTARYCYAQLKYINPGSLITAALYFLPPVLLQVIDRAYGL
jgi:hypothetical protein